MRLYLAFADAPQVIAAVNASNYPYLLLSHAYYKALPKITATPQAFIADSGAFTAWNSGKQVSIDDYAGWAKELAGRFPDFQAINLDVIPGEAGRTSTPQEREEGMRQSLRNADYLRSKGLPVVEVFHQDEPMDFLEELCQRLPEGGLLALSPRNDVSLKARCDWLQVLTRFMINRYRDPAAIPRCHGLAATSEQMLKSFPFFSADSSSWVSPATYGRLRTSNGTSVTNAEALGGNHARGPNWDAMLVLLRESIRAVQISQDNLTSLWKKRGVVWE